MHTLKNSIFSNTFWITLLYKQNEYHKHGVFLHTLKVVYMVLKFKDYKFIAAGLFHDLGKPFVAYQKEKDIKANTYSFTNHEEISYQIVKNWFFLSNWTKQIIKYHYLIRDIQKCKISNNTARLKYLEASWNSLDEAFINELKSFQKYDDLGKK